MEQLADTVHAVVSFFGLKTVIGFGVGAGANILSRFAVSVYCHILCIIVCTRQSKPELDLCPV